VDLIPDPELGGYTARVRDSPAYGEGETPSLIGPNNERPFSARQQ
jgi:hypothetical protein